MVALVDGFPKSGSAIYSLIWGIFLTTSAHLYRSHETVP